MALKAVVATLEGIPEALHGEYKQGEGGKYFLDVEGLETPDHPAVGSLVRAKQREAEAKTKAEAALQVTKAALAEMTEKHTALGSELEQRLKGAVPKENLERLEQSYKDKLAAVVKEKDTEIQMREASLHKITVQDVARSLATEVALDPAQHTALLLPHITPRLSMELVNGEAVTRVLDKDGKPSAATLEDLKKEILTTPMFSAVIKGTKASGGGAPGAPHASGAPVVTAKTNVNLAKLGPKALAAELQARAGE